MAQTYLGFYIMDLTLTLVIISYIVSGGHRARFDEKVDCIGDRVLELLLVKY